MIVTSPGVTLSRRPLGESDRLTILYTRDFGKLPVRFVGVLKPKAKLKALSEPLIWGDYRLYLKTGAEYGKCVGGALVTAFPAIRADLKRTHQALYFLELASRLTPAQSPNPEKYDLLVSALSLLDSSDGPWLPVAYTLRLLELAGFGMRRAGWVKEEPRLWEALHEEALAEVSRLPGEPRVMGRIRGEIHQHLGLFMDQPLNTESFLS